MRNPTPNIIDRSKYEVCPYFFAVNISFHVMDISRFKKKVGVGELWGGGARRVLVAHGLSLSHGPDACVITDKARKYPLTSP